MPDHHRHVDLDVLYLVERMLSHHDDADAADDGDTLGHLAPASRRLGDERKLRTVSHPAAHVPEQPLIAKEPVTPLPRRR
jgi:hypothetical protein